jgi:O-antigen ligase
LLTIAGALEPVRQAGELVKAGSRDDSTSSTELRLLIWRSAIDRAMESGFLGLGPGPHLPMPAAIQAGRRDSTHNLSNLVHPHTGLIPNFEAHNTVLDLLVQGGLIVLLDFGWLICFAVVITIRSKHDELTALLGALAIFSLFHFTVRQPLLWFAIVLCLLAGTTLTRSQSARKASA